MKTRLLLGSALLLALGVGCDRQAQRPGAERIYAAWEGGLTLVYEAPDLPASERADHRLQVRVASSRLEGKVRRTELSYGTFQGEIRSSYRLEDGGVFLQSQKGEVMVLPSGFPERVDHWETRGLDCQLLGYGSADHLGLVLPKGSATVGVWVEVRNPSGHSRRVFYLPGLGELEALEWREGRWVAINRLVSVGFSDAPVLKKEGAAS